MNNNFNSLKDILYDTQLLCIRSISVNLDYIKQVDSLKIENKKLKKENEVLKKELEYYSNKYYCIEEDELIDKLNDMKCGDN